MALHMLSLNLYHFSLSNLDFDSFYFTPLIVLICSYILKINRIVLKTLTIDAFSRFVYYSSFQSLVFFIFNYSGLNGYFIFLIAFFLTSFLLTISLRVFVYQIFNTRSEFSLDEKERTNIVIFGAGRAGRQLSTLLSNQTDKKIIAFIDDSKNLEDTIVNGVKVFSRNKFSNKINNLIVDQIFIAIPSINEKTLDEIIDFLSPFKKIKILPSLLELLIEDDFDKRLISVQKNNVLGRPEVTINEKYYNNLYSKKVVLVTGAGGSIGSEICKQLMHFKPKIIILFEQNEFALYKIDQQINELNLKLNVQIHSIIGSVCDKNKVSSIIKSFAVDYILHAAAYKHVPLLENNILEAAKNNILGSKVIVDSAIENGVKDVLLFPLTRL